jgi:uncharacterized membrane protein
MSRHLTALALTAIVAAIGSFVACGGDDGTVDCETATVPTFSEVSIWPKCTNCHASTLTGGDRQGAPEGINFDNYADAVAHADKALDEVDEGAMPIPDASIVTEEEKQSLAAWVECGTPE